MSTAGDNPTPPPRPQSGSQLGHALHKEKLDESAVVYVRWPQRRCHLLRDGVVFVDSPGIDVSQVSTAPVRSLSTQAKWLMYHLPGVWYWKQCQLTEMSVK